MKKNFLVMGAIFATLFLFSFKSTSVAEQEIYLVGNYTVNYEVIGMMLQAKDMPEEDAGAAFQVVAKAAKWAWKNDCKAEAVAVVAEVATRICCGGAIMPFSGSELSEMEAMGVISQL